jgi:hypothetical protein
MLSKVLVGSTTADGGALTVLARAAQTRDGASTRLKRMPAATWQWLFPKADVRVLTPAEFKEAQAVAWKERWDEGFCQAQPAAAAAGAAAREVGNSSDTHGSQTQHAQSFARIHSHIHPHLHTCTQTQTHSYNLVNGRRSWKDDALVSETAMAHEVLGTKKRERELRAHDGTHSQKYSL